MCVHYTIQDVYVLHHADLKSCRLSNKNLSASHGKPPQVVGQVEGVDL